MKNGSFWSIRTVSLLIRLVKIFYFELFSFILVHLLSSEKLKNNHFDRVHCLYLMTHHILQKFNLNSERLTA